MNILNMNEHILTIFLSLIILIISFIFYKNIKKASLFFNLLDKPDNFRKNQAKAIPLMGGIYIFFIFCFLFLFIEIFSNFENNIINLIQFCFCAFIFLFGLADDKININANIKIVSVYILFLLYLYLNQRGILNTLEFKELNLSVNIMSVGIFFTALCLLIFLNASNMFDGIDGQAGGYFLFLTTYLHYINGFSLFLFLFSISIFIHLIFNMFQKWYLGDSGVYLVSFFISILIIDTYHSQKLGVEQIFLLMMVPGLDLIRLFFERLKKGRHPFSPDTRHIHHLLSKKFDKKITLILNLSIIIIPNILAFYFQTYLYFILITFTIYSFLIISLNNSSSKWN